MTQESTPRKIASVGQYKVLHDHENSRYIMEVDDNRAGLADYVDIFTPTGANSGTPEDVEILRVFTHTETSPDYAGQGHATYLITYALIDTTDSDFKGSGYKIVPQCPFVKSFCEKHPIFQPEVRPFSLDMLELIDRVEG